MFLFRYVFDFIINLVLKIPNSLQTIYGHILVNLSSSYTHTIQIYTFYIHTARTQFAEKVSKYREQRGYKIETIFLCCFPQKVEGQIRKENDVKISLC